MNELELINVLKEESGLKKSEAAAVVDVFFDEMSNALAKGDRVEGHGLCSFYVKKYKAYSVGTRKRVKRLRLSQRSCLFLNEGRNKKRE